ncbi:MAG: large-conductance mechanosensitive channel protein MscL [Bacillota bacterium]
MGIIKEFKEFSAKGNVIDLAVGIIIGGAFGKIVSSFVADVIMPPLGVIIGGVNFTDLKLKLKGPLLDASGKILKESVTLNIGNFLQSVFDFLIIAFAIFLLVRAVNKLRTKEQEEPNVTPALSKEEMLLAEIRDILKATAASKDYIN